MFRTPRASPMDASLHRDQLARSHASGKLSQVGHVPRPARQLSRCEGADSLPSTLDLALTAAAAASDKQARDVVVLDVSEPLVICDYFVICSGSNDRQVRAIAEAVQQACREGGARPLRREGEREAHWILLDFIDVVVHVFHQEEREYYDLERLWRDAPVVARSNEVGSLVTA
jgi:ribosome-associated protein